MYLNKVFIIGNLTRDPEMRSLPSGVAVSNFSVATNRVWKDRDGNKQESAEFHNVVVFNRQAETVSQYLKKGSSVLVEGRLQTRSWEGQDGQKRYRTEIVADRVQFGPRGAGQGGQGDTPESTEKNSGNQDQGQNENLDTIEYPEEDIKSEDIPF